MILGQPRWGILPPDTTVQIRVRFTGDLTNEKANKIISTLIDDPQFQNHLRSFFSLTKGQNGRVVQEEAARLLRNIFDSGGPLTAALREHAPCVAVSEIISNIATKLASRLPALANIQTGINDVLRHKLDGTRDGMLASDLFRFTEKLSKAAAYKKKDGKTWEDGKLCAAKGFSPSVPRGLQEPAGFF